MSETKRMTQSQLDALYTTRRDAEVYDEAVRARAAESALAQRHAALLEAAKDLATKIDWYAKDSVGQHPKLSEPLAKVRALLASEPVSS